MVIGDVGSGKTIVAFTIALMYLLGLDKLQEVEKMTDAEKIEGLESEFDRQVKPLLEPLPQAALLAPTEVLAFQHYQKLEDLRRHQPELLHSLQTVYFSGKQIYWQGERYTPKQFEKAFAKFLQDPSAIFSQADNEPQPTLRFFWVGTHALLYKNFLRPDLVLVDEQHRFGVSQRQQMTTQLRVEGGRQIASHFISFTATPIPRSLALTIYRDLKPHFLKRLSDRKQITTKIYALEKLEEEVVSEMQAHLEKGRKIYVICPKIEEEDKSDQNLWSVYQVQRFIDKHFPEQSLLVHGKLKSKKERLKEFRDSTEKNILISTTVVEVGVDVSQASLMVIFNSERFGLSALHQIRGRIGRNSFEDNTCLLLTEKEYLRSRRLRFLTQFQDGFQIAQKDMELRGRGDLLGRKQSGEDGLESLLSLDAGTYNRLQEMVDGLDWGNLEQSLPRLQKYVEQQSQEVWGE
jgi:RecG-like helicase